MPLGSIPVVIRELNYAQLSARVQWVFREIPIGDPNGPLAQWPIGPASSQNRQKKTKKLGIRYDERSEAGCRGI